jgi:hypothetical protein
MSSAAAAFLMNSLAGNQTPPTSPPATPSPNSQQQMNFLGSPTISSPNKSAAAAFNLAQALNSFGNFNVNSFASNGTSGGEIKSQHESLDLTGLNKSFNAINTGSLLTSTNFSNSNNLNQK